MLVSTKDYPSRFKAKKSDNAVDIYFLLDLSGSMKPYRDQLTRVPETLIEVIK